jgi:hypothetical protein
MRLVAVWVVVMWLLNLYHWIAVGADRTLTSLEHAKFIIVIGRLFFEIILWQRFLQADFNTFDNFLNLSNFFFNDLLPFNLWLGGLKPDEALMILHLWISDQIKHSFLLNESGSVICEPGGRMSHYLLRRFYTDQLLGWFGCDFWVALCFDWPCGFIHFSWVVFIVLFHWLWPLHESSATLQNYIAIKLTLSILLESW